VRPIEGYLVRVVVEQTFDGERPFDIYSRPLKERIAAFGDPDEDNVGTSDRDTRGLRTTDGDSVLTRSRYLRASEARRARRFGPVSSASGAVLSPLAAEATTAEAASYAPRHTLGTSSMRWPKCCPASPRDARVGQRRVSSECDALGHRLPAEGREARRATRPILRRPYSRDGLTPT
jgi:hypothetical protein